MKFMPGLDRRTILAMELSTENLRIRSITTDDAEAYADIVADPEVMRYLGGSPIDSAAASEYIADCIQRDRDTGISRYAVLQKTDGAFIGFCGFKALTEDLSGQVAPGTAWVDFGWRYQRASWGRGYGTEAAIAVYDYGKKRLHLENVEARAHRDNVGSLRIIEKLGFIWLNDYESPAGIYRRYREG